MGKITRREFLFSTAGAAVLLGMGKRLPLPGSPAPIKAAVAQGTSADTPADMLKTALDGLGGIQRFVQPGQTVAIKVNATWAYPPHTASSSDPELIQALVRLVQAAGAGRIIVLDHCSIDPGAAASLRVSGIGKAVEELGVEKIFPNLTDGPRSLYTPIDFAQGKSFQQMRAIKAAAEADVRINLALAKSHNVTKMSMCLKHMMGLLEAPGLLHADLEQGIADINTPSTIQAQLHILEAIRVRVPKGNYRVCAGPETDLTAPDIVHRVNQIVAGSDPALIDAYACVSYFGVQPAELNYLTRASETGVGDIDAEQALADGRLQVFSVGQPQATATVQPVSATPPVAAVPARSDATATPLPTATPEPPAAAASAGGGEAASTGSAEIIDARSYLNGALIPAAAIVAGAGLVALRGAVRKAGESGDEG